MLRKVFKTGNSVVISLPKEALEFFGLKEGSDVSVDIDRERQQILITPVETQFAKVGIDQTFARQVAEFIEEYRPALVELSKCSSIPIPPPEWLSVKSNRRRNH